MSDGNTAVGQPAAELTTQVGEKREALRKLRFKHAMGQLRETHQLRGLRRELARLLTQLGRHQVAGQVEETT